MMATVRYVTSSSGLRKFQADGLVFDGVYHQVLQTFTEDASAHGDCITAGNWVLNEHCKQQQI